MKFINLFLGKLGFRLIKKQSSANNYPNDFEATHTIIINKVRPFTMTSQERIFGLVEAVNYISKHQIVGCVIECGVWKGGSMLAIAETLVQNRDLSRDLFLYDTFDGMSEPTEDDVDTSGKKAGQLLANEEKATSVIWAYSGLDEVKANMKQTAYPAYKIHYIQGKVEDTIPTSVLDQIALLRLDTDWYESTKCELEYLFPRLVKGGVIIIDDYGCWQGARKAVDEYFSKNNIAILLNRMDDTGRIGIKQ